MSEGLHICRGVSDIGTGLQAVAAAITDPDTISAYQTETRDGSMSNRTFYGGVHEMAGGVHDAAGGINELGMVCQAQRGLSLAASDFHPDCHCSTVVSVLR